MIEMALILEGTWYDNEITDEDVLVRVSVPDEQIILNCLSDDNKRVVITFEELEAIQNLIKTSRRAWKDSSPSAA